MVSALAAAGLTNGSAGSCPANVTVGSEHEVVGGVMGVRRTKALKHHDSDVGLVITVGIFKK